MYDYGLIKLNLLNDSFTDNKRFAVPIGLAELCKSDHPL